MSCTSNPILASASQMMWTDTSRTENGPRKQVVWDRDLGQTHHLTWEENITLNGRSLVQTMWFILKTCFSFWKSGFGMCQEEAAYSTSPQEKLWALSPKMSLRDGRYLTCAVTTCCWRNCVVLGPHWERILRNLCLVSLRIHCMCSISLAGFALNPLVIN